MNIFTLEFKNENLEKQYQKETKIVRFFEFYRFLILELLMGLILLIIRSVEEVTILRGITFIIMIFLIILLIFINKKFKYAKYVNQFYLSIHLFVLIVFVEVVKYLYNGSPKIYFFYWTTSVPTFVCLNSMLLIKIKWYFQSCLNFSFHIYYIIRVSTINDISENPAIIVYNFICFITFSIMAFSHEKTMRKLYERLIENGRLLNDHTTLLKNIIPSPIVLINTEEKEILFENNSSYDFFVSKSRNISNANFDNLTCFQKMCCILKNFTLLTNPEKNGEDLINELLYYDNSTLLIDNEGGRIIDFPIYSLEKIEKVNFFQKQLCYSEKSNSSDKENEKLINKKYFNFKFLKINWLNKNSILLIIDDISDIHKLEELQHLDKYKDQLLATVSHDLRTPLNGMMGMIESAINNIDNKKDKKKLMIAKRSGQLLLSMINDILDFSQINNKKLGLSFLNFNLVDVIKQSFKLVKFQAKSKGLKFLYVLGNNIQTANVFSDSNRIQQILLNLLNNAIKFTQKGFVKLSLEKDLNKSCYKISVEDSGIGICESEKPKLFKLFGKLKDNAELNRTGVGLGLTISLNLALLLNEKDKQGIYLESVFGKGSKFWFTIPFVTEKVIYPLKLPEKNVNSCNQIENSIKEFLKNRKIKLLIVDDDMINIMVASEYCKFFGIDYIIANDGLEAIEKVEDEVINKNFIIDGIFMDINMPFLDGYKASISINKKLNEISKNEIPIIAMTANIIEKNNKNFLDSGMKGFVIKPVSRSIFGETILKFINLVN